MFTGDGLGKAIEINQIIGSGTIVSVRGPGTLAPPTTLDAWKHFNDPLSVAAGRIRAVRMTLGFHNHDVEFRPVEGPPLDILAANKDITSFHLNLGLCLKGGGNPIAFIQRCLGRVQSVLCQDFEGRARWKEMFAAAEGAGGLQFYLIQRTDSLSLVPRGQRFCWTLRVGISNISGSCGCDGSDYVRSITISAATSLA